MDAFTTSTACRDFDLDLDLQYLISEYCLLSFIEVAQTVHEISW